MGDAIINEEPIKRTGYQKGKAFEEKFCAFMVKELGYREAERGTTQHSANNPTGIKLDIIGKRNSSLGEKLKRRTKRIIYVNGAGMVFVFVLEVLHKHFYNDLIAFIGMASMIVGYVFLKLADIFTTEYAWVECKDWARKVAISDVEKMLFEYKSNKKSRDAKHKFKHKYFVSSQGFVHNAETFARNNGIICYICSENGFIEI